MGVGAPSQAPPTGKLLLLLPQEDKCAGNPARGELETGTNGREYQEWESLLPHQVQGPEAASLPVRYTVKKSAQSKITRPDGSRKLLDVETSNSWWISHGQAMESGGAATKLPCHDIVGFKRITISVGSRGQLVSGVQTKFSINFCICCTFPVLPLRWCKKRMRKASHKAFRHFIQSRLFCSLVTSHLCWPLRLPCRESWASLLSEASGSCPHLDSRTVREQASVDFNCMLHDYRLQQLQVCILQITSGLGAVHQGFLNLSVIPSNVNTQKTKCGDVIPGPALCLLPLFFSLLILFIYLFMCGGGGGRSFQIPFHSPTATRAGPGQSQELGT